METLSSKEFFDQLKTNSLKPAFALKGIVKKSETATEVLFTTKGNFDHWVTIPSSMIESVKILKTFSKDGGTFIVAKLYFTPPITPEGKVFLDLLSVVGGQEMNSGCGCSDKALNGCCHHDQEGHFGRGGAWNNGPHCGCGHQHAHYPGFHAPGDAFTCECGGHHGH